MLPRVAIVDPELTRSLPPNITASTGLDALTQLIESYVSTRANPMTDNFCLDGIQHASACLVRAYANGDDSEARTEHMAWPACLVDWPWPTRDSAWCMASQRRSEECSKPRMALCARRCFPRECVRISARCGSGIPTADRSRGTPRLPVSLPETRKLPRKTARNGWKTSRGSLWRSHQHCGLRNSVIAIFPELVEKGARAAENSMRRQIRFLSRRLSWRR